MPKMFLKWSSNRTTSTKPAASDLAQAADLLHSRCANEGEGNSVGRA